MTISEFDKTRERMAQSLNCDDRVLLPSRFSWLERSALRSICRAVDELGTHHADLDISDRSRLTQQRIAAAISDRYLRFDPAPLFSRRLDRLFPHEDHASRIERIISLYNFFARRFAQCFIVSHVEVVLNQWCTS